MHHVLHENKNNILIEILFAFLKIKTEHVATLPEWNTCYVSRGTSLPLSVSK